MRHENRIKILIVDDDPDICRLVMKYLGDEKYKFFEAGHAEAALRLFREEQPQLVVLDYHLGERSGLEVLHGFTRQSESAHDFSVVVLTADNEQQVAVQFFRAGAEDFILKPFDKDFLVLVVERAFAKLTQKTLLKASEMRYSELIKTVSDYTYRLMLQADGSLQSVFHSSQCEMITGYTPEDFISRPSLWLDIVHPDDRELVHKFVKRLKNGEATANVTHRLVCLDGHQIWVSNRAVLSPGIDGEPARIDGMVRDITDIREIEEALRLRSHAIDQMENSMMITSYKGLITYVNPAFERITGYAAEEVIGQTPRILASGEHKPEFYQEFWDTILAGDAFYGRFINRKKDGQTYIEGKTVTPLRDSTGRITHFVSTGRDITEQIATEEHLRKAEISNRVAAEIQEDLDLARTMQTSLLTRASTVEETFAGLGYRVAIFNQAPATISGDFFIVKPINKRSAGLFFADTCGHGISAALISIRVLGILDHIRSAPSHAGNFLEMLNDDINDLMPMGRFIAASYLILDHRGHYCIANAAQPYPILMQNGQVKFLQVGGSPLGQFSEIQLDDTIGRLRSGDRLILHTDGLIEAENSAGEQYGEERLRLLVQEQIDSPLITLQEVILNDLKEFTDNKPLDDDLSIVIMEKI